MKQISVFLIAGITILMGCDKSVPLEINTGKVYPLETACGKMEFRASAFSNSITIYQDFKTGEFELNFDSLAVSVYPQEAAEIKAVKFYDKDKVILDSKKMVKSGDLVSIYFTFLKPVYTSQATLLILPCNYIVCNGRPLISDTLRINF